MKTLKLLLILFLFSLRANATGYAHNMFVAHQKLKTGKEAHVVKTKPAPKQAVRAKVETFRAVSLKENKSAVQHIASSVCDMATLNDRILYEGPYFLFEKENNSKETDESIVSKLVGVVKAMVLTFAGSIVSRG